MSELQFIIGLNFPSSKDTQYLQVTKNTKGNYLLNPGAKSKATIFKVTVSEFLFNKSAFYLGQKYSPTFNGKFLNLEDKTYSLSKNIAQNTFSFQIFSSEAKWGSPVKLFSLDNLNLQGQLDSIVLEMPAVTLAGQQALRLTYSPTECTEKSSCLVCGKTSCPQNFTCINGDCQSKEEAGVAFGIRVNTSPVEKDILTYKFEKSDQITVFLAPERMVRVAQLSLPMEQWFFADAPNNLFSIGKTYPIYILVNGIKKYMIPVKTTSVTIGTNEESITTPGVVYDLNPSPLNAWAFSPTKEGNWREYVFTEKEFTNLDLGTSIPKDTGIFALWQNKSLEGQKAVIGPETILPLEPPSGPPPSPAPVSVSESVWIWIVLIVIILVVAAVIGGAVYWATRD